MSSSVWVWVQLYYKGKDEPEGNPFKIKPIPEDVADLAEAVKAKLDLDVQLHLIYVYPPDTEPPFSGGKAIAVGKKLTELNKELENTTPPTSENHPLIVVAPDPKQANDPEQRPFVFDHDAQSASILAAWCTLTEVPTIGDLPNVVQAALTMALPSHHSIGAHDRPEADVVTHLVPAPLSPELGHLRDSIHALPRIGDNEDSMHSIIDDLIMRPMKFLGDEMNCNIRFNRNGSDATGATIKSLRPDVLAWLPSGVLAFKGEDKASVADINVARNELLSKLNCFSDAFFGRVPYQICYAAGGDSLEFVAIDRNPTAGGRPVIISLAPQLNLDTVKGRSLCVRYAVNITRVLASLQRDYPDGSVVRLGDTVKTRSSVVTILGAGVIKRTKVFTNADTLTKLYSEIQFSQVNCLCSPQADLKISRSGVLTARIGPVGFCGKMPASTIETKAAGRRLLGALEWLHRNGWVHRDIRPANVMLAEGDWYLMDLEWANTVDLPIGKYKPNADQTPPEVADDDTCWSTACDMWQFGKLLLMWNHLDEDGRQYVTTQTHADPSRRLSATESLAHRFFAR